MSTATTATANVMITQDIMYMTCYVIVGTCKERRGTRSNNMKKNENAGATRVSRQAREEKKERGEKVMTGNKEKEKDKKREEKR